MTQAVTRATAFYGDYNPQRHSIVLIASYHENQEFLTPFLPNNLPQDTTFMDNRKSGISSKGRATPTLIVRVAPIPIGQTA